MTINIYWTCLEDEWQRDREPELVSKFFYNTKNIHDSNIQELMLNKCPFFNQHFDNLYQVRSIYSYNFKIENNQVVSNLYDQKFFDNHVQVRSISKKVFSFKQQKIFYTDAPGGLDMTAYEFPYLEDNNITKRTIPIVGTFNIGKWFRNTEYPFYLKNEYDEFVVEENEIMFYLRFHTKEKIKFRQFYPTNKILDFVASNVESNSYTSFRNSIDSIYNNFKIKKFVEKEIKNNLL